MKNRYKICFRVVGGSFSERCCSSLSNRVRASTTLTRRRERLAVAITGYIILSRRWVPAIWLDRVFGPPAESARPPPRVTIVGRGARDFTASTFFIGRARVPPPPDPFAEHTTKRRRRRRRETKKKFLTFTRDRRDSLRKR